MVTLATAHKHQTRSLYDVSLWFIIGALISISLLHYLTDAHLIPYHSIYRSLYYVPIAVAAVRYGRRGGIATALATAALYLPHVVMSWSSMPSDGFNDMLENVVFLFVGAFAGTLADAERKQRQRAQESATQLADANARLKQQAEIAEQMRASIASILESIDSGVITANSQGTITTSNPAAQQLLGDIGESVQTLPEPVLGYYQGGASGYQHIHYNERVLGLHGSPLIGARGETVGTVLVVDDVTEQRALEEQVQRAQRLAALGRLASGLAHEIRNPMAIVRAAAQMLRQQLGNDSTHGEYTHVIQTEVDRVDRLIEELLAYARPTIIERTHVDANEIVERAAALVHAYAVQHQVAIETATSDLDAAVRGDAELLLQAMVNLVMNAIQATPAGGTVKLETHRGNGAQTIELRVSDTGAGIPELDQAHIFDPFFTTKADGIGLGLSIVQQIVAEHNGGIAVESALGRGTCFTISLPLDKNETPQRR